MWAMYSVNARPLLCEVINQHEVCMHCYYIIYPLTLTILYIAT